MVDSARDALRRLRLQQGLSLAALAARTRYDPSHLGGVERGRREPNAALLAACDTALGTTPLLTALYRLETEGDDMRRRAILGGGFAAASTALLATVDGTAALAATVDKGLRDAVAAPTDWDTLAADFARRHVLAPGTGFGHELAAQLTIASHHVSGGDRDAARGAALLALTYGLWLGDTGRMTTAGGLYATSAALADSSGDPAVAALVRARAANRGLYEGWTARRAQDAIDGALHVHPAGRPAVEAYAAAVHLHTLTGNLAGALAALAGMRTAADTCAGEHGGLTAEQRIASYEVYIHGRIGDPADALRLREQHRTTLAAVPLYAADADIYTARALVRGGDVDGGCTLALTAIRTLDTPVRVLAVGARDVLAAVPAARRARPAALALAGYAGTGPNPWETV